MKKNFTIMDLVIVGVTSMTYFWTMALSPAWQRLYELIDNDLIEISLTAIVAVCSALTAVCFGKKLDAYIKEKIGKRNYITMPIKITK